MRRFASVPLWGLAVFFSTPAGGWTARPSAENDGRFILELRVLEQPVTTTATLIAYNEDNVIVTKEIEVTITPQN